MLPTRPALAALLLVSSFGLLHCAEESKAPSRPAPPTCQNTCEVDGGAECRAPGFRVCRDQDGDGCLEWSAVSDCGIGSCIDGACADCIHECADGNIRCTPTGGVQTCGVGGDADKCREWLPEESCEGGLTCSAGRCREGCVNECGEVGVRQCNGDGVQECVQIAADDCLHWGELVACDAGMSCSNGKCSAVCGDECTADSTRCAVEGFETCGNFDGDACLEWSEVTKCANDEICSNGKCGDVCVNECGPEGQRDCTGAGVRICGNHDGNECLEWGQETPCADGQTCSNGRCSVGCTNECAEGGKQCAAGGTGVQTCGQFDEDVCLEWSEAVACDLNESCSNGECAVRCVNECARNARQCAGAGFQVCGDHDDDACLEWGVETACQGGTVCSGGRCLERCVNECAPGAAQCAGRAVQSCGEFDGDDCTDWGPVVPCPQGEFCSGGVCGLVCGDECLAGATRCAPGGLQACGNSDEDECTEWGAATPCPGAQVCSNGRCAAQCVDECGAGAARCSANGVESCGQFDGDPCQEWGAAAPCPQGEICSNGACAANCSNECAQGSRQCSGAGFQTCGNHDADDCREWSGVVACAQGTACSGGVCTRFCADECLPGRTRCGPGGLQSCGQFDNDDCKEWSPGAACPGGQVCDGGACVHVCNDECQRGATACSMGAVIECGDFDADVCADWSQEIPCAGGEVCRAGVCELFDPACGADGDCPDGFICAAGGCVESRGCQADAECAAGESCDALAGVCRPGDDEGQVGAACVGDPDCGPTLLCGAPELGGYCTDFCAAGLPCPLGSSCYQVDPEDPEVSFCFRDCGAAAQCEQGQVCYPAAGPLGGACWFPECQEDADCAADGGAVVECIQGACLVQNACDPASGQGCADGEACVQTEGGPVCLTACIVFEGGCPGDSRCVSADLDDNGFCLPTGPGGPGDACIEHGDCDADSICVDDGLGGTTCRTQCDTALEEQIDCEDPQECVSLGGRMGICLTPCDNECNPGDIRCTDAGLQACEQLDEDVCLEWGAVVPCAGGDTCNELELDCLMACLDDAECAHPLIPASCQAGRCVINSECDPATGEGCAELEDCFLANADGSAGVCLQNCDPVADDPQCANDGESCGFFGGGDFCVLPGEAQAGEFCDNTADCAAGLACLNTPSGLTTCFALCNAAEGGACADAGEICVDLEVDGRIGACIEPCEDQCAEGSQQCGEGGLVQTCAFHGAALCLDWDGGFACGDGEQCDPDTASCRVFCDDDADCEANDGLPRACDVATGFCDLISCATGGGAAECPGDSPVCMPTEFDEAGQPLADGLCLASCDVLGDQAACGVDGKCDLVPQAVDAFVGACLPTLGNMAGQQCDDLISCEPGTTCVGVEGGGAVCATLCAQDADCGGAECVHPAWFPEPAGVCGG